MKLTLTTLIVLGGAAAALAAPTSSESLAVPTSAFTEAYNPAEEDDQPGSLSAEEMLQTPHDAAFEAMADVDDEESTHTKEEVPCSVACKTIKNHGGGTCVHRYFSHFLTYGLRGHYCNCNKGYAGTPCDLGPSKCGKSTCFQPGVKKTADKSLLLSAVHLSVLAYHPGQSAKEKAERNAYCPGIDGRMALTYKHYKASRYGLLNHLKDAVGVSGQGKDTRLEWGVAHGSYGQRDGENLYAIAFRGTVSLANWITNLKALASTPKFLRKGYVHWGFLAALRPHINEVVQEILKSAKGHDRLLVAGHSLGGALANIFALIIAKKFKETGKKIKVQLITLGSPRVGTAEFQRELESEMEFIHRIVGKCDAVPKVPRYAMTTSILAGLPFAKQRLATMVHAGPQITVGCNTWWCTHHHLTDHLTATYLARVQKLKGKDDSLCPKASSGR